MNYYNELNPFAAQWLGTLIERRLIDEGSVVQCDINELSAADVRGSTQFHAFAGIGVWSYALRLAGWPAAAPVWTGSCPCQPFSAASAARRGTKDKRHLWPAWRQLIAECHPPVVFGEQVASPDGRLWLDAVSTDLEALGYAVGASDLCAAGVGAPHIRQRLFFVACSTGPRADVSQRTRSVGHTNGKRVRWGSGASSRAKATSKTTGFKPRSFADQLEPTGATRGFWTEAEWLPCLDGKARPVEPGTFPLVDGAPGRVGRLRAYGNAIVPQVAARFIRASMMSLEMEPVLGIEHRSAERQGTPGSALL